MERCKVINVNNENGKIVETWSYGVKHSLDREGHICNWTNDKNQG